MIEITAAGQKIDLPTREELIEQMQLHSDKFMRFAQYGYNPHLAQVLFHLAFHRRRTASAGRRGGKTYSAAWEFSEFIDPRCAISELKKYGVKVDKLKRPDGTYATLPFGIIIPEEKNHDAAIIDLKEVLRLRGLKEGKDFVHKKIQGVIILYDKGEEFARVKIYAVAKDPNKVRGDKLLVGWYDEGGFLPDDEAWRINRPSYADYNGIVINTTSPSAGNNRWFYDAFIDPEKQGSMNFLIEWLSLDNPFIEKETVEEARLQDPKHVFEREYMAKWDKPTGGILDPVWISYYRHSLDADPNVGFVSDLHLSGDRNNSIDRNKYDFFIGIDPAITPEQQLGKDDKRDPDFTAAVVIARDKETGIGYVVDIRRERISFPQQLDLITELNLLYQPISIGIEEVAFQKALVQMSMNIDSIREQQIIPVKALGNKDYRLSSLGPIIRSGIIKFNPKLPNRDSEGTPVWESFYNEFRDYGIKNSHDDMLDALDICIRAGSLFGNHITFTNSEPNIKETNKVDFRPRSIQAAIQQEKWDLEDEQEEDFNSFIDDLYIDDF